MSFFSRLFGTAAKAAVLSASAPVKTDPLIPSAWMPNAIMKRVILHWTAGSYTPSEHDKDCYHLLIDGWSRVVRGKHSILANERIGSKSADYYAAHTRGTNTGSIGLSICAMSGANEVPFRAGEYPLKEEQWVRAAEVTAELCKRYGIPVNDKTVLTHAEVQKNLGKPQSGKWDISRLPFSDLKSAKACGDNFRAMVKDFMR
jgi:hypothetical protein